MAVDNEEEFPELPPKRKRPQSNWVAMQEKLKAAQQEYDEFAQDAETYVAPPKEQSRFQASSTFDYDPVGRQAQAFPTAKQPDNSSREVLDMVRQLLLATTRIDTTLKDVMKKLDEDKVATFGA